ncbi:MAG: DUF2510 domain-containing protein [Protaetiibacter sp.]
MESASAPAAGWFPDPGGSTSERWWSGDAWTEHTRQPLGNAVPEAFAAHVGTLVEERGDLAAEAPSEERVPAFAFAMTPTEPAEADGAGRTVGDELTNPGRHVAPDDHGSPLPEPATAGPARPAVPPALLEAHASAAPVMTVPVVDPGPSVAMPTPPAPAPVATAASVATPVVQAPATGVQAPAAGPAPAPAPGFTMPSFAQPVAPAPAAAEAAGFVMPNLAAPLVMPDEAPAPSGRHADEPAYVPEAPRLEVQPAAAPVGFTSSADPTIANRYRQAIHAPEQAEVEPLASPFGALSAPPALAPGASASQPGWSGMPLPSSGPVAPGYALPASTPPGYAPPGAAPAPGYAAAGYAAPAYAQPTGSNKAAKLALSSGISSLAAVVFIIFGRILIVPSVLSLVAIVAGIVGLVLARRAGVGKWSALGGLLMGITTSVTLTVSLVMTVLGAFALDTSLVEDDVVENAAALYGIEIVSASCPDEVSALTATSFTCTAFDSAGGGYVVDVELTDDGYMTWELRV